MEHQVRLVGRNLTFDLFDSLGSAIVTGRYGEQHFPTEAALAKYHGVSRSVTREAMKMLAAKGLVIARPRQGTSVRPATEWNLFDTDVLRWMLERQFSIELLRHFTQLRMAIEPEAAALAADPADLERIAAALARVVAADRGRDDVLDAGTAFHAAVLRATRNPFYAQSRDVVATALRKSIRFIIGIEGPFASIADHAAVADAITARDPDAARQAMRRLIGNVLILIDSAEPVASDVQSPLSIPIGSMVPSAR